MVQNTNLSTANNAISLNQL